MSSRNQRIATWVVATLTWAGCNATGDQIDRVQTNLVDKRIFEGEWWYSQTVVDVSGDEAGVMGTFEGQMAWADLGVDNGRSGSVARIRWVIDEDFLFAYRAYELVDGGNDDAEDPRFRGQPLAVFEIEGHVDIRQDYNPLTGERTNVRIENTSDRRWYERQFMRVDWSQNQVTSFFYLTGVDLFGVAQRESAPFFFQAGSHEEFPESYQPQFVRVSDDPDYRRADEWPTEEADTVHYMSFVTQELLSPGPSCLSFNVPCQTAALTVRNSFLRVPPDHRYAVARQSYSEFDRFGVIRTQQRTYVRGGDDREVLADRCESDADCGGGAFCDQERHICTGGLTGNYGETDQLAFYRSRHNFWRASLTDTECAADWQCDGRYSDTPGVGAGSVCDQAARRCTVPMRDRALSPVVYHLNAGFPTHLVSSAFEVIGDWNETFMRGWRAVQGQSPPTGPAGACQSEDPTRYCFCGSADDLGDGTCRYRYDPFVSPAEAADRGVVDPYDCYVARPEGAEPGSPSGYEDYLAPSVYQHEFVGEECMLMLRANSCDLDPELPCEELGDLRYQFFNYITHGNVYFGGVSIPLTDPTTGELISSNANVAAESVESVATTALDLFPVLRAEPGATEAYFEGETLRSYYARLGNTEHPATFAPSGTDGTPSDDRSRPALPVDLHSRLLARVEAAEPSLSRLQGADGRAQILSDRLSRLADTVHERRALEALGADGRDALEAHADVARLPADVKATDEEMLPQTSPYRSGFLTSLRETNELDRALGRYMVDPPFAPEIHNRVFEYWAEAFRDRPPAEASLRMQQLYLRGIMHHEMGHSVGLHHNFAGSFDRDNYHDGYFNVVDRDGLALPALRDFDGPAQGGDGSQFVDGPEVNAFLAELRRVRNERNRAGLGMTMTNSVMDYHGDLGILGGIGRYDVAAALYNHFDIVEAYTGDPRTLAGGTLRGLEDAADTGRTWWQYYVGGESCTVDEECPYAFGRAPVSDQPVYQRCIRNPRREALPTPCAGDNSCICSNLDEDFLDYIDGVAYRNDADGNGALDHYPVRYLYCDDTRINDISWCSQNDAGESFQESVDHFRRRWEESYPLAYYRRFRRTSLPGQASYGSILTAAKIYQHLFFRFFNEPGFRSDEGPLGFDDQYLASVDAMNWLTEIVNLPDSGSYRLDATTGTYQRLGEELGMAGADVDLPVGTGFPLYSQYQEGFYGFFRRERAGVLYDKLLALMALTRRDWNLSFTIDERYFINFYDLFPVEMTEFFGGLVLDDPSWHAPRLVMDGTTPRVQHLSWWRGDCLVEGEFQPCRGPQPDVYPAPPIEGTSSDLLRSQAAIYALAEFPVFYDTSFEQRLLIFKRDAGEAFDVPDVQPDGDASCAYGSRIDPAHGLFGTDCTDADYVVYNSDRFHNEYIAVKVRPRLTFNLEEEQLGFQLLRRLVDRQDRVRVLEALPTPTAAEEAERAQLQDQLIRDESFLELLIDIQRIFGITSYL